MRKLTVPFFVVTPSKKGSLSFKKEKITLPRAHALELARFIYESDMFTLDKAWFDRLPLPDRALVDERLSIPGLKDPIDGTIEGLEALKFPRKKKRGR